MTRILATFLTTLTLLACGSQDSPAFATPAENTSVKPRPLTVWGYEVVESYPHAGQPFTQGLFIHDGTLYESSGQYGESAIIRHDTLSDVTPHSAPLPPNQFGEGSTVVGDKIISLTWRDGVGYIHDLETLERLGDFPVQGEGWGLAYDGKRLILSDGTDRLRFLSPNTFEETGSIPVRAGDRPVTRLNELEFINGELWANIWQTDVIVRVNPDSGQVLGFINLKGLYRDPAFPSNNVLNGIAYDADTDRLFVTGKRWPKIYEIKVVKGQ